MGEDIKVLHSKRMLDEMIMDVEVRLEGDRVKIKFVAIAGGCGPELNIDKNLACELHEKLGNLRW